MYYYSDEIREQIEINTEICSENLSGRVHLGDLDANIN
jgi:hypothetical protein